MVPGQTVRKHARVGDALRVIVVMQMGEMA